MNKSTCLKHIQDRLPDDIILEDETPFDFSDDEIVGILSWIKYFKKHYLKYGKEQPPLLTFPIVSTRLRLDFGVYRFPSDIRSNKGKHVIYISQNGKELNGKVSKNSVKELVRTWKL